MSDTPRTFSLAQSPYANEQSWKAMYNHACQLERELSAAQAKIAALESALREIQDDCETVARDESITVAERRTWRVISHKCNNAIRAAFPEDFQDER